MSELKPHEYCRDCPGPAMFKKDYDHLKDKVRQMCVWKDKHEADQMAYRKEREKDEQEYRSGMRSDMSSLRLTFSKWAIGVLTSVVLILIIQIVIMYRQ